MKAVVIFILGLVALQQVVAMGPEERNIKDEIIGVVNDVMQLVANTMEKVLEEEAHAVDKTFRLMYVSIDLVNNGINAIVDLINDLEKRALDMGVDISYCVVNPRKAVEELRVNTNANLRSTADRFVEDLNKIKHEAVESINSFFNSAKELLDNVESCGEFDSNCMLEILAKATDTLKRASVELPLLVIKVINSSGEAADGGSDEMLKITKEFTATTLKITTEITTCAAQVMPM